MSWTVQLQKPGKEFRTFRVSYLGARIMRPLAYRWGIFYEEYEPHRLDMDRRHCEARFLCLRRSEELARVFNPARLPA